MDDDDARRLANERHLQSYENSGEQLVRELRPQLLRRARRFGLRPFVAEEIVQEAFLALFARRPPLRHVAGWLTRVLDRRAVDLRRREATRRAWERESVRADAAFATPRSDERLALREAIATLPRGQRELVRHRYFGEQRACVAAERAGYRPTSAKKLLSRALRRLRVALAGGKAPPARHG